MTIKWIVGILAGGLVAAVMVAGYEFYKPHRDVQRTEAFETIAAGKLAGEFIADEKAADAKYLAADGDSRVLIVTGRLNAVLRDQAGHTVLQLREPGAKFGVLVTLEAGEEGWAPGLVKGAAVKVKAAITAGSSYDPALDLYNDVILVHGRLMP